MTAEESKVRELRMLYSTSLINAVCAWQNLVLDMRKVSGLNAQEAANELMAWLKQGVPFQETIDAYTLGVNPDPSTEISLNA